MGDQRRWWPWDPFSGLQLVRLGAGAALGVAGVSALLGAHELGDGFTSQVWSGAGVVAAAVGLLVVLAVVADLVGDRRGAGRRGRGDAGSVMVMVAVLALAFIAAAGIALDGGRKLSGVGHARDLASNAARAGGQAVNSDVYRTSSAPHLVPSEARSRANAYLASQGYAGDVVVVGDSITVRVTLEVDTTFLPGPLQVYASETAHASDGS